VYPVRLKVLCGLRPLRREPLHRGALLQALRKRRPVGLESIMGIRDSESGFWLYGSGFREYGSGFRVVSAVRLKVLRGLRPLRRESLQRGAMLQRFRCGIMALWNYGCVVALCFSVSDMLQGLRYTVQGFRYMVQGFRYGSGFQQWGGAGSGFRV